MDLSAHKKRIQQELLECGMGKFALRKFNSRYLPKIIHEHEHIKGVIYGRFKEDNTFLSLADHMIIATDFRIISLNHKPGYTDIDEFSYDVVIGIITSTAGPFTGITLQTRLGDFSLRFVNNRCASIFVEYLELRRLEYAEAYPSISKNDKTDNN